MNFTITSSWVRFALPLSIFMLLITSLVGQTTQQAALVKDIRTGTASSNPTNFTSVGNIAYFTADDGSGSALWKSDGTAAGTVKIGSFYSNPQGYNGRLYVLTKLARVTPDNDQVVLWSYNGSTFSVVDTVKRSLGVISAANLSLIGSKLAIGVNYYPSYSTPYSETKNVRYLSDGIAGTTRLSDYTYTKDGGCGIHSYTNHYLADTLAFYSDLTSTCGNPEPAYLYSVKKGLIWRSQVYSYYGLIHSFGTVGNRLIFAAATNNNNPSTYSNLNLYSIGIDGDSVLLKNNFASIVYGSSLAKSFQVFNNKMYISDNDSRIWETDGTLNGTIMLTDGTTNTLPLSMNNPIALADGLYFYDAFNGEYRIWKIGTTGNIRKILSIPSATDKDIKLVKLNNELWQFANINTSSATDKPVYLYKIDVVNGTRQSISVANGLDFGNNNFVTAGLKMFASANDGIATNANPTGQELYQLSIDPSVANCANDNVVPYFGYCPTSTVKNITSDRDTAYYAFPSAFDNCSTPSVSVNITGALANNAVQTGNTVVIAKDSTARFEYTATDAKGNTAKCLFTVKVLKPCVSVSSTFTSICPRDTTIQTPDACTRVSWQVPTAVDNCGNAATVTQALGLSSGSCFPLGVQTITYNKQFGGTCSFKITVNSATVDPCITDIVKPIFANCPQNINLSTTGTTAVATWTAPTATDNCTATPSVSSTHNSGFAFPVGTTAVTYTATDAKGNATTCSFNIVVTQTITPPSNCASTSQAPWNEWIKEVRLGTFINASDKIRTDRYAIGYSDFTDKIISVNKGQIYPLSISNGLSWSGSQVNLNYRVWIDYNRNNIFEDTEKAFESTGISLAAIGNITIPSTATVGSTRMRVSMKKDAYPTACETFAAGEVEDYTVQIIDATQVCTVPTWVNVLSKTPTSVTLNWNRLPFTVSYDYEIRTSGVGGSGGLGLVRNSNTPDSIATIPLTLGTYQIYLRSRCTTGESAWNTGMTFTISNDPCANDSQAPVLANVPSDITISCPVSLPVAAVVTATDNCTTNVNIRITEIRVSDTLTTRTWVATDQAGNTASITQKIRVVATPETTPPVLTNCPANINLPQTGTTTVATWTAPTATDNCSYPSVSSTYSSGAAFSVGTTTVTYTAKDAQNNTATCSFTVTISPQTTGGDVCTNSAASVTTGVNAITVSGITTSAAVIQIFTNTWTPVYNQQVSGTSVTVPNIAAGTYIVKVTKLGIGGTWPAVCNVQINNVVVSAGTNPCATDNIAPVFANCPANISLTTTGTTEIGTWTAPTVTDNCTAIPSVSSNFSSGFAFPIGTTAVIYTAKDALNNTKTCSFTVTVTLQTTGGGTNDIGLTISATPSVYRQWTPITARVSAKNNGTTAMTNVKIELKRPAKTSSGGAKTPSVGVFNDYCAGGIECSEWVIPSLAAGATATLDAPFFVLDATLPIVITANLLTSTPTDATTANNTASISIASATATAPAIAQLAYQKPTQLIPIVVQRIAPNPTNGELIVKLESLDEREVTFEFFNTLGKLVKMEKRAVDKGVNRVEFEVYDLEQGVHFIVPSTTQGYKVPTKFVKM
jgi:ELWxxDGT repeat protein